MAISIKTAQDIAEMRVACRLAGEVLDYIEPFDKPGVTTAELDRLCHEAAGIGLSAVELWFRGDDFDELAAAAKRHKLALASMCGHKTLNDGLNKRTNHDRIEAEVRESIDIAVRLGIPIRVDETVMARAAIRPSQGTENAPEEVEEHLDAFRDALQDLDLDGLGKGDTPKDN